MMVDCPPGARTETTRHSRAGMLRAARVPGGLATRLASPSEATRLSVSRITARLALSPPSSRSRRCAGGEAYPRAGPSCRAMDRWCWTHSRWSGPVGPSASRRPYGTTLNGHLPPAGPCERAIRRDGAGARAHQMLRVHTTRLVRTRPCDFRGYTRRTL